MESNTGPIRENDATGMGLDDKSAGRRKSAVGRRKSSAVVTETPAAYVEASELSVADRRLAEMGYVQVSCIFHILPPNLANR